MTSIEGMEPHPDYVAWVRGVHRPVPEPCGCTWPRIMCEVCRDTWPCGVERDLRHKGARPVGIDAYTTIPRVGVHSGA